MNSRAIIHLDLDAFYAQVERVRLNLSLDTPICVQQWNGILAVSYSARKFGITRSTTVQEAKELCPDLVLVHVPTYSPDDPIPKYRTGRLQKDNLKASLHTYRDASLKIMKIIQSLYPNYQKASVDEVYIDVTEDINRMLLNDKFDPLQEPQVYWKDYGYMVGDDVEVSSGFADLQLLYACKISQTIRNSIWNQLGYTCSTGIAHNKTLSKLVSSLNKPNKQTVLRDKEVEGFMRTIAMSKIKGLGGKFGEKIEEFFEVEKASDLWSFSKKEIQNKLGEDVGDWLYNICRGVCSDKVIQSKNCKSIASIKTFNTPVTEVDSIRKWLGVLSNEIYSRSLGEYGETSRWPKLLTLAIRNPSLRTQSCPFPHKDDLKDFTVVLDKALQLAKNEFNMASMTLISLTISGFEKRSNLSLSKWLVESSTEHNTICLQDSNPALCSSKLLIDKKSEPQQIDSGFDVLLDMVDENGTPFAYRCPECNRFTLCDKSVFAI
ncbi:hypothetical protein BC833DRAFT_592240 [Globomyces pollinis-pini]|nr:hypothetical protein BC833DRAFT_592240 [Globomyces pollinis-pini]